MQFTRRPDEEYQTIAFDTTKLIMRAAERGRLEAMPTNTGPVAFYM